MKHMTSLAGLTGAMTLSMVGVVQAQEPPMSRVDYYEIGQEFAHCSAHFRFGAEIARRNGMEDAATAIEGMERGWTVAGLFFLVEGLDPSRQTEAETVFENLKLIEVDRLKAEREVARARGDENYDAASGDRFAEQCGHWVELQHSIIRELRSGPTS